MTAPRPDIRVVEAEEGDIPAISTFFRAMWDEAGPDAPGFSGATEEVIAEIARPEAIAARIGGSERRMFIAYRGDAVVAFAATRARNENEIELAGIVVLQSMVGMGIGTPLVEMAIRTSRDLGYSTITVSTEVDNQRALAFYQARGFVQQGQSAVDVEGTKVTVASLELTL